MTSIYSWKLDLLKSAHVYRPIRVYQPWMFSSLPGTEIVFVLNSLIHLLLLSSDLMYSIWRPFSWEITKNCRMDVKRTRLTFYLYFIIHIYFPEEIYICPSWTHNISRVKAHFHSGKFSAERRFCKMWLADTNFPSEKVLKLKIFNF